MRLRTLRLTASSPPGGVQRMPALSRSRPFGAGGAGGGGGAGVAAVPHGVHGPQLSRQNLYDMPPPARAKRSTAPGPSATAAGPRVDRRRVDPHPAPTMRRRSSASGGSRGRAPRTNRSTVPGVSVTPPPGADVAAPPSETQSRPLPTRSTTSARSRRRSTRTKTLRIAVGAASSAPGRRWPRRRATPSAASRWTARTSGGRSVVGPAHGDVEVRRAAARRRPRARRLSAAAEREPAGPLPADQGVLAQIASSVPRDEHVERACRTARPRAPRPPGRRATPSR